MNFGAWVMRSPYESIGGLSHDDVGVSSTYLFRTADKHRIHAYRGWIP